MLLELNHVTKKFGGITALSDISFGAESGQILGIIGPNGAGKTTIFNLITGVYQVTEGDILFDGASIENKKPYQITQLGIARTFQNIRLFTNMTVLENILVGHHSRMHSGILASVIHTGAQKKEEEAARAKSMELLEFLGLGNDAERMASELPYGKQRKLEIARAMSTDPRLILLDEPAAGMNDSETEELGRLIQGIRSRFHMTIILIEHDMNLMMHLCDRIVVVNFGEKLAEGIPKEIQENKAVIEAYLGKGDDSFMLLEMKDVVAGYGNITALKGISLSVPEGSIVTLIGANGAGKSTTMKTIMGIVKAREGTVAFQGKELKSEKAYQVVREGISLVPEGRQILQNMTVQENLELGAYQRNDSQIGSDMEKIFERFPRLKERRRQYGGTLSGGEQQMLAIGRAVMARPKLLLLDEPSMGLAPLVVQQIFDVIKDIHKTGTTVLLVEQNAQKALQIADYAYVMETGKIVIEGPAADVAQNPQVRAAYLGGRKSS
ncbi:MAG TPA: high-affinity branched-chain amino acid ABC transporter ATP-binding protein LivG [Veillonellaceae bacterium]|nr:high-affinity branched-chain amino acid ABC transporter ATP-binding protein LivG [Veillonellaceae bacterium]